MPADDSGPQLWDSGRMDIDFVYDVAADTRVPAKAGEGRVESKRPWCEQSVADRECNQ